MHGKLYEYFEKDHKRLEGLLSRATEGTGEIDLQTYGEFRSGLLRHIGLEEKVLFPAAQKAHGGEPFPSLPKLRLDHGALTALMVPPPSRTIIAAIRAILAAHDALEESPGGPYEVCELLAGMEIDSLTARVQSAPAVPLLPHRNEPFVLEATKRALARAGYNLEDYEVKNGKS
jgi:hypothetical protein